LRLRTNNNKEGSSNKSLQTNYNEEAPATQDSKLIRIRKIEEFEPLN
jgi:hypothetical protein